MTKKKRELIDIILDNVKPEDWPDNLPYAAQDIKSMNVDYPIYAYKQEPVNSSVFPEMWNQVGYSTAVKIGKIPSEICKHWNKTIVHRDEFMKRWNDRNTQAEAKTPQQLALEKFGTDWHDNEGVQPVDDEVLVDVMFFNETKSYEADPAVIWGWRVERKSSSEIKKWRIHSDDKESRISEKEKELELLRQPMPPCSEEIPCRFVDAKSPLSTQIGGDHYTKLAIQPMQYCMKNGLDPLQHTIIKYVTRFRDKAGIEDLEKAKHCIDMLIEFEKESK
jgi:hypothetical protein